MTKKNIYLLLVVVVVVTLTLSLGQVSFAKSPYRDNAGFPKDMPKIGDIIQIDDPSDKSILEGRVAFRRIQKSDWGSLRKGDILIYFGWQNDAAVLYRNGKYYLAQDEKTEVRIFNTERH